MVTNMDVITNIKETFEKAAKTAVTKSNEIIDLTKLKFAISDAETEISKLMREIGKAVYEAYKENAEPDESINVSCATIDEKYEEIEKMRVQMREIKNLRACEQCGSEQDDEALFCSKCGQKF